MLILSSLEELNIDCSTSVALGNFDGLHVGHRVIMEDTIKNAKERDLKSLCFTFSNHPFNYIMNRNEGDDDALKLICSEDEKIKLIEEMGFDILVVDLSIAKHPGYPEIKEDPPAPAPRQLELTPPEPPPK